MGQDVTVSADHLPLQGGEALSVSTRCSAGLWRLLSGEVDRDAAVRLIRINPTLTTQLEEIAPAILDANKPITEPQLMRRLVELWKALGLPARTASEWEATANVYLDTLGNCPAEAIDAAIKRWNRCEMYPEEKGRHGFFPRPAELYAMAEPKRLELGKAAYRARLALQKVEQASHRQVLTPEAAAKRRQEAIDAGVLNPDGTVNMNPKRVEPVNHARPHVADDEAV